MMSSIKGKGTKMIDLISRLKVTTAKKTVAPQPKKNTVAAVKVPTASTAKVTAHAVHKTPATSTVQVQPATKAIVATTVKKCIMPTVATTTKPATSTNIDNEILNRGLQNKQTTASPAPSKAANQAIIDKYRADYEKFLKQLENMDFGALIFGQPTTDQVPPVVTPTPEPKTAPVAPAIVEAPIAPKTEPEPVAEPEPTPSLLGDFANGITVGEEMGDKVIVPAKRSRRKKAVASES